MVTTAQHFGVGAHSKIKGQRWCCVIPPCGATRTVFLSVVDAFREIVGNNGVKTIDAAAYIEGYKKILSESAGETYAVDLFNQSCALACLDFGSTHFLTGALAPVTLFTLQLLKKHGIVTCHWFYEDYLRATYWRSVLPGYDHFFAVQHSMVQKTCEEKNVRYHFLPTALSCDFRGNDDNDFSAEKRSHDAVFIGIPSAYRIALLEEMVLNEVRLMIAGSGWNSYKGILEPCIVNASWVDGADACRLMRQARTGVNLSFEDPRGRTDCQVSPRIFDLAASGCIIVSEDLPLLKETVPEIAFTTFSSNDDIATVVKLASSDYGARAAELSSNRDAVYSSHRYLHRVKDILRLTQTG